MAAPADAPPEDRAALASTWRAEIETAEKDPKREKWLERCRAVIKLYEEDRAARSSKKRFALFWANIEVLKPAVLARAPQAVVTRRFKDADPVGRVASEVLERALNFILETDDFGAVMKGCRDEFLLLARAQSWVRYVPTIRTKTGAVKSDQVTDTPETYEVVDWEEVRADRVHYEDFLHNVARSWEEVRWVARKAFLTRQELIDRFGDVGRAVDLDWAPQGKPDADDALKKACVYEIWDRVTKRAIWISKGHPEALDARDDPLKLRGFFPCPRPMFGTLAPGSLSPIPDFVYYQDQIEEIDKLTTRIDKLIEAMRVRGFYPGSVEADLNTLLKAETNELIPIDSWAALGDKGGLKGIIDWFPLDQVASALKGCFEARKQLIEDVYQVTGISDIARGDTDAGETATAQQLKASYGSSRVRVRKTDMAGFARDNIDIMGQVIAARFDPQTLAKMTGVQLLTNAEKAQLQQQLQALQALQSQSPQPGAPPPPPIPQPDPARVALLGRPSWEDVTGLLRDPQLRAFRIDIESDSTVEPNDQEEKQRRIEFVTAIGKYLADSLPVVQAAPPMLPVVIEGLKFLVRGFRVGREMEDVIDRAADQLQQAAANPPPQQQKPGPDPQAEQMKAQAAMLSAQAAQGKVQVEAQRVASDHQQGMAQVAAENLRTHVDGAVAMHEAVQKAEEKRLVHEINDTRPIQAPTQ